MSKMLLKLAEGQSVGESKYKYTCKECGKPYTDSCPPDRIDDKICHRCMYGLHVPGRILKHIFTERCRVGNTDSRDVKED